MVHLERLAKPDILAKNETKWTESFIQSGKDRPSSSKYGHPKIKEALANISANKCFYSEILLSPISDAHIDHYVEVSEDKTKAFDWNNLYFAHKNCNIGKSPNKSIPVLECLDPFTDSDEEIEKHLYFEDEMILAHTDKGRKTIQKYNLNSDYFNLQRSRTLTQFYKILSFYKKENKIDLDDIRRFANSDRPFSLMFRVLLKKYDIQ